MRRLKLSTKMLVAALPLILAVSALLALTVRNDLQAISSAEKGAELGELWDPLTDALTAIETEAVDAGAADAAVRRNTDSTINVLRDAATRLNASTAAGDHITASRSSLSAARRNQDMADIAPDLQVEVDPVQAYAQASREIVAVGQLLPSEAGDPELGRELLAVVKLAEAKLAANGIITNVEAWQADPSNTAALRTARDQFGTLETVLGEFEAIAPEEWAAQFRQIGFAPAVARARGGLDSALRAEQTGSAMSYDITEFEQLVEDGVQFQLEVSDSIVERSRSVVDAQRQSTLRRLGIALGVTVLAVALAWLIARSITKRIRAVSAGAQRVTTDQLPALVEALRDPRGQGALPAIEPVTSKGTDELAELADSFNTMQGTLVDVAHQQVEVLRRGVSDIFVTMARRNRSLIDRQLAMLDEFEAEVDDPEVLANYYQLDHMATRMRRNSESLLVLANAEPKRRRVKATEVDDVVRAAIGEVEDYRRIEIEALESLQVRGNVVADVSHLLAELLDNATSFSPPDSVVRVGGRMSDEGYMIRILDGGVGIGTERLNELNTLLREPPVVGLSVESTLGMSVVSLLANKHGIAVTLSPGNPGLIVDVVLPPTLFGPIDAQAPVAAAPSIGTPSDGIVADLPAGETSIVAWDDAPVEPVVGAVEHFEQIDPYAPVESETPAATSIPDDEDRPVTTSDWRNMSLSLAAFQSGMQSAQTPNDPADDPYALPESMSAPTEASDSPSAESPVADEMPVAEPETFEPAVATRHDTAGSFDAATIGPAVGDEPLAATDDGDTSDGEEDDEAVSAALAAFGTSPLAAALDAVTATPAEEPAPQLETPTAPAAAPASQPLLPPPPAAGPASEFDHPPAPPLTVNGPSSTPVSPVDARPVPHTKVPEPTAPSLPTRTPGAGPDGGPDRLAEAAPTAPGLPTRSPADPVADIDETPTVSAADPDALRDRLRAFQAEFRSALGTDTTGDPTATADPHSTTNTAADLAPEHTDLGGDR